MLTKLLAGAVEFALNRPSIYNNFDLRDSAGQGPGVTLRPKDNASLSQVNNTSFPQGLGKRKSPFYGKSQCCLTSHGRGMLFAAGAQAFQGQPNGPEDLISDRLAAHARMTYSEFLDDMWWQDCPSAREMYSYSGNPISCNANYAAMKNVFLERFGLRLMDLDNKDEDTYADGQIRLREFSGLTAQDYKELYTDVFASLGPADFVTCLVLPFKWGHYVSPIEVVDPSDEYPSGGLLIDDPYGVMHMNKAGYAQINSGAQVQGQRYVIPWEACPLAHKRPGARVHVLRFE